MMKHQSHSVSDWGRKLDIAAPCQIKVYQSFELAKFQYYLIILTIDHYKNNHNVTFFVFPVKLGIFL